MAITKIKSVYDCTDEMPKEKYELLKKWADAGDNPRFLREDWHCDIHGDFYEIGVVGRPFPVANCADCKREEQIIKDSEEAIAKSYLPFSGLFKDRQKLILDQFTGDKAKLAKEFLKNKSQLILMVDDSKQTDSLLACAMVGYVCRGGRQGQIVTMYQLTCRIQASWKGKKTTEDLLNEMIAYPFLVIEGLESGQEEWFKKFLTNLIVARIALKRKTMLLSEESVRYTIPEKIHARTNSKNKVELPSYLRLNYSPSLEEMEGYEMEPDDNDGIPL